MTNHWVDMINADVVLIMGGNPAEDHPISMNWLARAKERGTYILHVDPRFNRTSSIANVFAKLRSGTDIAFVGGMINYAIEHNRIQEEFVREYTNASWIVGDGYGFADGLFAGFDPNTRKYDRTKWAYALDGKGEPQRDPTLKHPRSVFQLLKQHFARYNVDAVCRITGTPRESYLSVCDLYTSTFAPDRAGTWLYAMGTAQHSHGTQNIRSYAILQLLLGNIGVAGGGVKAMRGESNVQGSTDQGRHCAGRGEYGERQLAAERAEVRREPAQSLVGRQREDRQRFRLLLSAEDQRRIPGAGLLVPAADARDARRRDQRTLLLRPESRGRRRERAADPRRTG